MILVAEAAPAASQPVPPSISTECPALRRASLLREGDHARLHDRKHVLPAYGHQTYEADTVEQACRLAIEDNDWSGEKLDYDTAGETYVSGMWPGADAAYRGAAVPIPSQFHETIQRKADHFETLLGILKVLARVKNLEAPDLSFWLPRVQAAIAKAESVLAGTRDPG